ncbi:hydrolase, partial [Streptomyces sp. SID9727]|nr:hydrolase [Streptomyces sp. SID9727]
MDTVNTDDVTPRAETVETGAGTARVTWLAAPAPRLVLALGHGAGGGIEARDLQALG